MAVPVHTRLGNRYRLSREEIIAEAESQCFTGQTNRACNACPAHPRNGGDCCFGDPERFDEDDVDAGDGSQHCQSCIHFDDCSIEVAEKDDLRRRYRATGSLTRPASGSSMVRQIGRYQPAATAIPRKPVVAHAAVVKKDDQATMAVQPRPSHTSAVAAATVIHENETRGERFLKDVIWGAVEGALTRGLEFVRRYPW